MLELDKSYFKENIIFKLSIKKYLKKYRYYQEKNMKNFTMKIKLF